jgi:hypothetical protein
VGSCWPIAIARRSSATDTRNSCAFSTASSVNIPADKLVYVVLDNDGNDTHPKVRAWRARHRRWTLHCTPTSVSWLSAVEGFFAKLTRRRLQRGVFRSLVDFQAAINRHLADHFGALAISSTPHCAQIDARRKCRSSVSGANAKHSKERDVDKYGMTPFTSVFACFWRWSPASTEGSVTHEKTLI